MAPEALHQPNTDDGSKKFSKQVDVWSLGIILYHMLHLGKSPWEKFAKLSNLNLALAISDPRQRIRFMRQKAHAHHATLLIAALSPPEERTSGFFEMLKRAFSATKPQASPAAAAQINAGLYHAHEAYSLMMAATTTSSSLTETGTPTAAEASSEHPNSERAPLLPATQSALSSSVPRSTGATGSVTGTTGPPTDPMSPQKLLDIATHIRVEYLFRVCKMSLLFHDKQRATMSQLQTLSAEEFAFVGGG